MTQALPRRLAWVTDPHLNYLGPEQRAAFYATVAACEADAVLLGGDIGEAPDFEALLVEMEAAVRVPIYFVLGNHDFYRGSIAAVRERATRLSASSERLRHLPDAGVIPLAGDTALVGHGGWADGRCGDFLRSPVLLNDHILIREMQNRSKGERLALCQQLGDEAAAYFRAILPAALESSRRVLVLTHVPPFAGAAWHQGRMSSPDYLPHFASQAAGEALLAAMRARPDHAMLVLCGHTHSAGFHRPLPNLGVLTGGAAYFQPAVERLIDVGGAAWDWMG
jgi:predicted phosphodiesterase